MWEAGLKQWWFAFLGPCGVLCWQRRPGKAILHLLGVEGVQSSRRHGPLLLAHDSQSWPHIRVIWGPFESQQKPGSTLFHFNPNLWGLGPEIRIVKGPQVILMGSQEGRRTSILGALWWERARNSEREHQGTGDRKLTRGPFCSLRKSPHTFIVFGKISAKSCRAHLLQTRAQRIAMPANCQVHPHEQHTPSLIC